MGKIGASVVYLMDAWVGQRMGQPEGDLDTLFVECNRGNQLWRFEGNTGFGGFNNELAALLDQRMKGHVHGLGSRRGLGEMLLWSVDNAGMRLPFAGKLPVAIGAGPYST